MPKPIPRKSNRTQKPIKNTPGAMEAFNKAVEAGKEGSSDKTSIRSIKSLLHSPKVSQAMKELLTVSRLTATQQAFMEEVFLNGMTREKAVFKIFGNTTKGQEQTVATAILSHPDVKEFLDMVKLFYVQVAPMAALKEVEVLLDDSTSAKDRLQAAKQIKETAGITEAEGDKKALPVNIQVNIGGQTQTPTVISVPKED